MLRHKQKRQSEDKQELRSLVAGTPQVLCSDVRMETEVDSEGLKLTSFDTPQPELWSTDHPGHWYPDPSQQDVHELQNRAAADWPTYFDYPEEAWEGGKVNTQLLHKWFHNINSECVERLVKTKKFSFCLKHQYQPLLDFILFLLSLFQTSLVSHLPPLFSHSLVHCLPSRAFFQSMEGSHPWFLTLALMCQWPGRRQEVTSTCVPEKWDTTASSKSQNTVESNTLIDKRFMMDTSDNTH